MILLKWEITASSLLMINGIPFLNSKPLSHDRVGEPLRTFQLSIILASDEI